MDKALNGIHCVSVKHERISPVLIESDSENSGWFRYNKRSKITITILFGQILQLKWLFQFACIKRCKTHSPWACMCGIGKTI